MDVVRITANTHTLYAAGPSSADLAAVRALEATDLRWQIEARPRDAAALRATMYRTTNFYLAMLSLVVVLLAFGGYLIVRVTRRELEVARMKEEFVSTVSHEFRAPLTGIRQLGEILSRDRVSDERKRHQYYDLIVRESVRLTRLVENVLDFARVNKPYNFETLDTTSWLSAVAEEFRIEASRSGHMLEASIPANLPSVSGDREALSTAVRNLLDNACKYSPRAETVWLEAEAANGGVRVAVRDRGVGIPLREQRRIFEKFYRGEQLSKTVKGVGLGLSLVQRTVEAHRGRVQVDSREGEGSTFSIYLEAAS
jgi:signal transduction histidine kinase